MKSGRSILGLLNYNENKVKQGLAECIHENMYGREANNLSFRDKLNGLKNYADRNKRATAKALHISLNFHASERLDNEVLCEIASTYMDRIGFQEQPFLVYRHSDAAHPHIHIVTTNINKDGKRIILYNIGRIQSEKARMSIEKEFNLVKAAGRKQDPHEFLNPVSILQINYGRSEIKRSITNVVRHVARSYKYTSLPEFNAALAQFNIMADRGSEKSQMHAKKGLLYRVIDTHGNKIGIPIKASTIYGKPTLPFLEKQFKLNQALRLPFRNRLKQCIDNALNYSKDQSNTEAFFITSLNKQNIHVVFRKNEEGRIYGITFVDNKTKTVFNGSDLGKPYAAKALLEELKTSHKKHTGSGRTTTLHAIPFSQSGTTHVPGQLIEGLTTAQPHDFTSPDSAIRRKRRKKRKHRRI